SVYFLLRDEFTFKDFRGFVRDFVLAVVFASLATYANLAMINILIAIIGLFVLKYLLYQYHNPTLSLPQHGILLGLVVSAVIPLKLGVDRLLFLSEKNQLYFGEDSLFESVQSVISSSMYLHEFEWAALLIYPIIAILCLGLLSLVIQKDFYGPFLLCALLLLAQLVGLTLEHFLFEVRYPSGRAAIMFIPLFGLFTFYFIGHIKRCYTKLPWLPLSICAFVVIPAMVLLLSRISLTYTKKWHYDAHTKEVALDLDAFAKTKGEKVSLSNNWLFSPSFNFYIKTKGLNIQPPDRNGPSYKTDYVYEFKDQLKEHDYSAIRSFKQTKTILLGPKIQ
ncbi:MAG: hypothetical protein AB8F95_19650, partial [Bacteroidia bacterium]